MRHNPNHCRDVGNDHLSTHSGYDNYSCTNFPFHRSLTQVDSSTNFLDKMVVTEVVTQPTKNPRRVGTKYYCETAKALLK